MENICLLVHCLHQLKYFHKSSHNKRPGKNSILLHFHEVGQLNVLDIGVFVWALSLHTRQPTVMGSLKKSDTLKLLCPSEKFLDPLPLQLNVERMVIQWQQYTPDTPLSQSQLSQEQNCESPFSADSYGCFWCLICKWRHAEVLSVQRQTGQADLKQRGGQLTLW